MLFQNLINKTKGILTNQSLDFKDRLKSVCKLIRNNVTHYDWVGFYFVKDNLKELHLLAYDGIPTNHKIIPFGKGICGQVALSNKTFVVPDVNEQENYISCDSKVKSEIVAPIILGGENIGQIDVDSNSVDPFDENDVLLLETICKQVSENIINKKL